MADDNTYEYNPNLGNESKKDDTGFNPNLGADDTGFNPNLGADDTGFNPNLGAEKKETPAAAAEPEKEDKKDLGEASEASSKGKKKKFNSDEIAMFCDQIAMLLKGGISVYEGTYMLYSEMEDAKTKEVLRQIDLQVKENIPLYKALTATGAFPEYMVHMVEVGEKTGRLEDVMKSLAEYYERDSRVKAGLRSAIAYPMILFAVMAAIMVVLVWKILPMFERMFTELSSDVAASTENVLTAGLTAGRIIAVIICAIFAVILLVVLWSRTKAGSRILTKAANGFGPIR
ncbi:MAG: type II secretion system F family protein, partial [Lachnospiraceae bacterium]|nr:type II secretion system F family protein [Lachnospiraceae bacterium]